MRAKRKIRCELQILSANFARKFQKIRATLLWHDYSENIYLLMKTKLIVSILFAGATMIYAQNVAPIQLSLTPDIALESKDTTINGISLNIWGENQQHSLTLGIVNGSTGDSTGFSWGIVNYDDVYHGVQWGFVNVSKQEFVGWQRGFVNFDQGTFTGFQDGFVNVAEDARGFQLGLVNYAQQLNGLQIGILNVALNNPWFDEFPEKLAPGFPIVNWSF